MTDRDDRAEQAVRGWFTQEASGLGTGSIDPDAVRAASGRRQRLRFTGLLAAAAVLLAVLVIVPPALRPSNAPITGVPATPVAESVWTTTAAPPLSPRFGSLTAWLDGRFYVVGGWDGGPCPPGSMCDMKEPDLRDGARYDPATDSWTQIAAAPFPIGRDFADGVVHQGAFYVQSTVGDGSFWVYRPEVDQWQQLTRAPSYGQLVATSSTIVLNTYDGSPAHYAYRPVEDAWEPLPAGPIDSCGGWRTRAAGERLLVIGRCGADGAELHTSFYDPATGEWGPAVAIPEITAEPTSYYVSNDPVQVAGKLLWPSALSGVSSMRSPGIYDIETGTWREVGVDGAPGGLSFRGMQELSAPAVLDALGLVEANGNLLEVRTATWVTVPQAPVPDRWDPVVAAGPDSLLSCFGYRYRDDSFDSGGFATGCQLLTPG